MGNKFTLGYIERQIDFCACPYYYYYYYYYLLLLLFIIIIIIIIIIITHTSCMAAGVG